MANWKTLFVFAVVFVVGHGIHEAQAQPPPTPAPAPPNQTYRTSFHFQPPQNWMNDPNGPMVYNGLYHLFYQYNPSGADWGNIVWAHSTSTNLINWTHHEPAIIPTQKGDINGCWSGSATLLSGDRPAILYTGIDKDNHQVQNLAVPKNFSDPFLVEWVKAPENPLMVPTPENQINFSSFRDPTTAWKGGDGLWRVAIGNELDAQGRALLYRSENFVKWTEVDHPLHSLNNTGMWECPDFYPVSTSINGSGVDTSVILGDGIKHVLKVSLDETKHDVYTIGKYNVSGDVFVPDVGAVEGFQGLRYDYGKFYASKTFYDSLKGRRILWGWINESLSKEDYIEQGWSGVQSIPRQIWLDESLNQLVQWPVAEIEQLRGAKVEYDDDLLVGGSTYDVVGVDGAHADVEVSFDVPIPQLSKAENFDSNWTDPQLLCSQKNATVNGALGPFGLKVLASVDTVEYTAVFFRIFQAQSRYVVLMCSDQSRSSQNTKTDKTSYGVFLNVDLLIEKLSLRTLIDNSIVESFGAKGKAVITSRVYPTRAIGDGARVFVFNDGDIDVTISNLTAWSMNRAVLDLNN